MDLINLWDVEWIAADGTPLQTVQELQRPAAERQAQQWLTEQPGSRVYLYRRRGEVSVLVQVWNEG